MLIEKLMEKFNRPMFAAYMIKLVFRVCVFLFVLWAYFTMPEYFDIIITAADIR